MNRMLASFSLPILLRNTRKLWPPNRGWTGGFLHRLAPRPAALALLSSIALAQTAPLAFDVADVHPSPPAANAFLRGGFIAGGRYELHTASLVDLIAKAYDVENDAVYGGPNWLESDRFEILAKAAPQSTEADHRLMLQALLADRFKLVIHKEEKPLDVFALTVGKKPQLKESEGEGQATCTPDMPQGNTPPPYIVLRCTHFTMADFARLFRQYAGGYVTHPMVDLTGLKESYDFTIKWTGRGQLNAQRNDEVNPGISFFEAVDKQLGLKLAADKRPMPVIVVDSVNRTPTPNPEGVTTKVPALLTEFEAAVVKPSRPDDNNHRLQPKAGGQIDIESIPLKVLIAAAWGLEMEQDKVIGPKWMDSTNFDILAKTQAFPMSQPPPFDAIRPMLKALLIERFKIVAHNEDREVPVWLLTVGKRGAKLKQADPASRAGCKPSISDYGTGSATVPMINYTCINTTMKQLADAMHMVAGGYVDHPAVDMTGLTGAYDFTLTWTPKQVVAGTGQPGQNPAAAADPSGGTTFFDAVDKELGLHLESGQKRPMPVLVIDHVEQVPTEN